MIIKALKTFSDGVIAMHEGEIANVPDTKAQLFIAEGYAVEYTGEGGEIDLSAYAKKTDLENYAKSEDIPTMLDLAKEPIIPPTTKVGTYNKKFGNVTITEKSNNVVNVVNESNNWGGVFFTVNINPNVDNVIKYDLSNINTSADKLTCGFYYCNSQNQLTVITSKYTDGLADQTLEITLTSQLLKENNFTTTIVVGITSITNASYDITVRNVYGDTTTIETLKQSVNEIQENKKLLGKKVMFLGDSITQLQGDRSWVDKFINLTGATKLVNVAVIGAILNDNADTVLDGNPQFNGADSNVNNTLANQVQKIINNEYDAPDLIVIAIGTNSGITADDTALANAYYETVGGKDVSLPLEDIDRTTREGAFRWCNEKLHRLYPNAIICWCNPIQRISKTPKDITEWADNLRKLTSWGGVVNIETNRCGIMMANEVEDGNGEDLIDGLHPNTNGATKMARYNASAISRLFY